MDPASKIIRKFGGAYVVAAITGTAYTAPYRWQAPREKGGSGGLIPQRHHVTLLAYARTHGISLRAEDFLAVTAAPAAGPRVAVPSIAGSPPAPVRGAVPHRSAQDACRFELPPEAEPTRSADSERAATRSSPAPFSQS